MFEQLHPSVSSKKGKRIGLTSRYGCKQCGFPVDANRRSNRSIENLTDGVTITGTGNTVSISSDSGCPHCGSLNWSTHAVRQSKRRAEKIPNFRARRINSRRF